VIFGIGRFYGFWQGPIGQSALCFSLGGSLLLSRAASASCFCRLAWLRGNAVADEAAAKLFEKHPHFTNFPGECIEIMPVLPIPGA
jgi:hypothetical protein